MSESKEQPLPSTETTDAVTISSLFKKIQENLKQHQEQETNIQSLPNLPRHRNGESEKLSMMPSKGPGQMSSFTSQFRISMAASCTPSLIPSSDDPGEVSPSFRRKLDAGKTAHASKFGMSRPTDFYRVNRFALPPPPERVLSFDRPTFGQDFCASTRKAPQAQATDATMSAKKRNADDLDTPPEAFMSSLSKACKANANVPQHQSVMCEGFGWGTHVGTRQPTKEEFDDFFDFADKWIPTPKRRKTEDVGASSGNGNLSSIGY